MALEKYGNAASSSHLSGRTEFEILKSTHRFLRNDNGKEPLTWEEQLAKKYYDNLYREYAVCDLKHYKSGNFSIRWRTEDEVLSGAGETTCGNTRCHFHSAHNVEEAHPSLKTLELPFSYVENGESKFALVKVVLCDKCCKKLMWKRNKEKEKEGERASAQDPSEELHVTDIAESALSEEQAGRREARAHRHRESDDPGAHKARRRDSRSRSPPRGRVPSKRYP